MTRDLQTPEHTDLWNAERFAAMHGDAFRYVTDREVWVIWDGARWADADESVLVRAAGDVARALFTAAIDLPADDARRGSMIAWATKTAERRGIANMIYLARAAPGLGMRRAQFDTHPHLLNVANGTIDLRTGALRPHAKADYLTTITPIAYDPTAKCPRWDQFLREIFVTVNEDRSFTTDEELITFIHRAVGYSLTGCTREHAMFVLHGVGRNGKGRFITQLRAVLGDASRTTHFKTFTSISTASINSPAVASLAGARLVTAGEPDEGVEFSESLIKQVTGEDEIEAMAKYEAPFRYTPAYKIWFHCNHKPRIKGTDEGIWSRPRMVPFNVRFDNYDGKGLDKRDQCLEEKLNAEQPGILAWAVRGAIDWYQHGLSKSDAVKVATETYRTEQDTIGAFLDECCIVETGAKIPASDLHRIYAEWCKSNGTKFPLSPENLKNKIEGREGIRYRRTKVARVFEGVREKRYDERQTARRADPPQPPAPAVETRPGATGTLFGGAS